MNEEVVFTGILAELIKLFAERNGMTPSEYVLSFFEQGCTSEAVGGWGPLQPLSNNKREKTRKEKNDD